MDTNQTTSDVTATELAIAEKQAAIAALNDEIQTLHAQAEAEAVRERVAGIAERLGSTPEAVADLLAEVASNSGYSVDYLVNVVTGQHRVSNGRFWE